MHLFGQVTSFVRRWQRAGLTNRAIRHLIAGGLGTLIYVASVTIGVEIMGFHPIPSVVSSFAIVVVYTYVINRVWVYEATKAHRYAVPRFITVTIIALCLNTVIMAFAVDILRVWYVWGLLVTALIVPPTNFLLNFYWAFK